MNYVGLDIGGANLKASDGALRSVSVPFPMWQRPADLTAAVRNLLYEFPDCDAIALTMTGELADCFATKAEGVHFILDATNAAAQGRSIAVWQTGAEFCTLEQAHELTPLVAAANWHALATWVGRIVPHGPALLIDIGSTTTDLIPLGDGWPMPQGLTDLERLRSGELQYLGVRRTPLCALTHDVPLGDGQVPIAAELFATTADIYLLCGDVPDQESDCSTANGQPATKRAALDRLARQLCCDATELSEDQLTGIASWCRNVHQRRLLGNVQRVANDLLSLMEPQPEPPRLSLILSGEGEFLARQALTETSIGNLQVGDVHSLGKILGPQHSQAACAFALSRLRQERD